MRKFVYLLLSTILIVACAEIVMAQGGRIDTTEARERMRERQRIIEDPANSPFKAEPYEKLKPAGPSQPNSPLRAIVELQVIDITDGDTFIINNTANQQMRIRLQGIDAPEAAQSFGSNAQKHLSKLLSGKWVSIEFDPRGKPDKEGRIIAKIYLDGRDIGLEQIKSGFAWYCKDYKEHLSESDRYTYAEAEKEARNSNRGLWKESTPLPPWEFRTKQ